MKLHDVINEVKSDKHANLAYKGAKNRKIPSNFKDSKKEKHGKEHAKKSLEPIDAEKHYSKVSHNKQYASEIIKKHKQVGGIRSRVSWYVKIAKKHGTTTEVCKKAFEKVKDQLKEGQNNAIFFGAILPAEIKKLASGKEDKPKVEKKSFKKSVEEKISKAKKAIKSKFPKKEK